MPVAVSPFEQFGMALVPNVLREAECAAISARIAPAETTSGGTRNLLLQGWCAELARRLLGHPVISELLPAGSAAVQCTYFEKSASRNWLVPLHQDLSIPVAERVGGTSGLTGWSTKEGSVFVHAPSGLLEHLAAVRVHLESCAEQDGPLRVVPGSHRYGRLAPGRAAQVRGELGEVECTAETGTALVMRPLLLHSSSKAAGTGRRRVLHFLFGPRELTHGLRWQHVV